MEPILITSSSSSSFHSNNQITITKVDDLSSPDDKSLSKLLFNLTMKKEWKEVEKVYQEHDKALTSKLTKSEDTGLHIAISSYRHGRERNDELGNNNLKTHIVNVINLLEESDRKLQHGKLHKVLASQNVKGDTPLHLAAATGWVDICDGIASKDPSLISIRNSSGETPLFVAAHHGQLYAFLCLDYYYYGEKKQGQPAADYSVCRTAKEGNTILHSAISGEYFKLAFLIINKFGETLINKKNVNGETPLHILARMPNVFKSSRHLDLYDSIIYRSAPVEKLEKLTYTPGSSSKVHNLTEDQNITSRCPDWCPKNYQTCANLFTFLRTPFHKGFPGKQTGNCRPLDEENQQDKDKKHQNMSEQGEQGRNGFYPRNHENTVLLLKFGIKIILVVLGFGYNKIKKIREKRKRHARALEIMNELVDAETQYEYDYTGQRPTEQFKPMFSGEFNLPYAPPSDAAELEDKQPVKANGHHDQNQSEENTTDKEYKSTPILEAAKWGIPEMVKKILGKFPMAIHDLDGDGKNLLMVAAQYRQISVFDELLENEMLQEFLFHQVDDDRNSILHLAARLEEGAEHWDIPGYVLQMQGEIKWYKYVKAKVPQGAFARPNKHGDTPKKIFADTHGWLRKEAADWMKTTSESCSVIAALVASVGFATSASIPGGPDQGTGYPLFKQHPMFNVFAVTSFIALSLSVTALVLFLSVITSRCQEKDFKSTLPNRLFMGLTSLLASIALMLVSFCAGHSFILRDKVKVGGMPIYVVATIPVMLFALAQLPLYCDLSHAMHRSVLRRSYKLGVPSRRERTFVLELEQQPPQSKQDGPVQNQSPPNTVVAEIPRRIRAHLSPT